MFSGLSENEAYFKDKVPLFVALGPVTKISHTQAELLKYTGDFYDEIARTLKLFGINELMGKNWLTSTATKLFCGKISIFCQLAGKFFINTHPSLDDNDRFAVYMGHEPNGTSVKSILHYAQNMKEDRF